MHHPKPKKFSLEFPRQKKYLGKLNLLLDSKPIRQPEQLVKARLFPSRRISSSQSVVRIKHIRSQNSIKRKEQDQFRATVLSKLAQNLSCTNRQKQQRNTFAHFPRSKSLLTKHGNGIQNMAYKNYKKFSTPFMIETNSRAASPQLKQNGQEILSIQHDKQKQSQKHQFLRKGSSINRQIVINLLKLKFFREKDILSKQQFSNDQIIKMIKLYKGNNQCGAYENNIIKKNLNSLAYHGKDICGWDNNELLLEQFDERQ